MSAEQDSPAPSAGTRRRHLPRGRRAANPEARMPLMEHIRELRNRVLKALLAVLAGAIVGWFFLYHPVWAFIEGPYCKLPASVINPNGSVLHGKSCNLYFTG